jgi:hypothetical protein
VSVAGNYPQSLSFAHRLGFTEERREVGLVLSLAGISPPQVQPPTGIEIVTWTQRPELARGMYEVELEAHPDIPRFEDIAVEPFEDWMAHCKMAGNYQNTAQALEGMAANRSVIIMGPPVPLGMADRSPSRHARTRQKGYPCGR